MIYFIGTKTGYVKIGFTERELWRRLAALQTGNPEKIYLIACISGDRDREASLHDLFRSYRSHGEWFRIEGRLRALLKDLYTRWTRRLEVKPSAAEKELMEITRVIDMNDEDLMRVAAITGRRRKDSNRRQAIDAAKRLDAMRTRRNLRPPGRD